MLSNLFNLEHKKIIIVIFLYSIFALLFAFYFQYVKNYPPCELCLYQRIPYFFSIIICILYLTNIFKNFFTIILLQINFLVSFVISGFHYGVEEKFWVYKSGCTNNFNDFENIDQLRMFLEKAQIIKCDEVILSIFGVSMAAGNMLISLSVFIILSVILYKGYANEKRIV